MASKYRSFQDGINDLGDAPMMDPAVLAWALAAVVDRRIWEVRVARYGVCVYPIGHPPEDLEQ